VSRRNIRRSRCFTGILPECIYNKPFHIYTSRVYREKASVSVHSKSIQREGLAVYALKKYTERGPQYQYTQPSILGSKSLIYALFKCIYEEVSRRYTLKVYREQGASQVHFRSEYITSSFHIYTSRVYREKASQHMHSRSIQRENLSTSTLNRVYWEASFLQEADRINRCRQGTAR
jgi:hypothetical protein